MADCYLDHNVAIEVAVNLRSAGHRATTTAALGKQRARDDEQLTIAADNRWILITHNISDFELLHDAWRRWSTRWGITDSHPGILAMEPGPDERRLAAAIEELLRSGANLVGEFYVWRPRHGWVKRP